MGTRHLVRRQGRRQEEREPRDPAVANKQRNGPGESLLRRHKTVGLVGPSVGTALNFYFDFGGVLR